MMDERSKKKEKTEIKRKLEGIKKYGVCRCVCVCVRERERERKTKKAIN